MNWDKELRQKNSFTAAIIGFGLKNLPDLVYLKFETILSFNTRSNLPIPTLT